MFTKADCVEFSSFLILKRNLQRLTLFQTVSAFSRFPSASWIVQWDADHTPHFVKSKTTRDQVLEWMQGHLPLHEDATLIDIF